MDITQLINESDELFSMISVNLTKPTEQINFTDMLKTDIETYKLTVLINIANTLKEINQNLEFINYNIKS